MNIPRAVRWGLVPTSMTLALALVVSCGSSGTPSAPATVAPPAQPSITSPAQVTAGATGLKASVAAQAGCSYTWAITGGTITAGQGTAEVTYTAGLAGPITLRCVAVDAGGGSSPAATLSIAVVAAPQTPAITAPSMATAGAANLVAWVPAQPGMTYTWTLTGGTITSGAGSPSITFTAGAPGPLVITCVTSNGVGAQATAGSATVTVVEAPATSVITTPAYATQGTAGLSASVPAQPGASYLWTLSGGTILSGQGTPALTFAVGSGNTANLACVVTNAAGTASAPAVATVTLVPAPATPSITADPFVTTGAAGATASVADQPLSTYAWSITGGTITGGNGTRTITYTPGPVGPLGLSCVVTSAAGVASTPGAASVTVVAMPSTPAITAPATVTATRAGYTASVAPQAGMTYGWTLTGGSLTAGQGSASVTFTAGPAGAASVACTVTNAAGARATGSQIVTVAPLPVAPVVTAPAHVTTGQAGYTASIPAQAGMTCAWTVTGGTLTAGQGTELITFTAGSEGSASAACTLTNAAGDSATGSAAISVVAQPATPVITAASGVPAESTGNTASVVPQANATYAWTLTGGTISSGQGTNSITYTAGNGTELTLSCVVTNQAGTASTAGTRTVAIQAWVVPAVTMDATLTAGKPGRVATTQDQGPSATYAWSLTNATLTSGQGTRTITFTANAVGTVTASVTVQNPYGGPDTASASASVVAAALTPDLLAPNAAHPGDTWMKASLTPQAGMTYGWSQAGTAAGTILSGQGTPVAGFSAGSAPGTLSLQAEVRNPASDATSATASLTVASGTWVVKDGGVAVHSGPGASMTTLPNGRILVAGGQMSNPTGNVYLNTAMLYDPATQQWVKVASMGTPRQFHTATLLADGRVLVVGGLTTAGAKTPTAEIYDPATNVWTASGSLTYARNYHAAVRLFDGKVAVVGGSCTTATNNNTVELFDPAAGGGTGAFTLSTPMAVARYYHTLTDLSGASTIQSTLLAIGGTGGTTTYVNTSALYTAEVGIYNGTTLAWTTVTALTKGARQQHTATLLNDGRVLIAGSLTTTVPTGGVNGQITCEVFDPSTGPAAATFSASAVMATFAKDASSAPYTVQGRYAHTAVKLPDGRVLLSGGNVTNASHTSEIFDPAGPTCTATSTLMAMGRYGHRTVLLATGPHAGKVLTLGGTTPNLSTTLSAELFDPASGTWASASGLASGRQWHTASVLSDGRVLVAGGWGGLTNAAKPSKACLSSAQIYDPSTHTWTATGSLNIGRYGHTATRLSDGRVLVVGGMAINAAGTSTVTTPSAEIWDPATGTWTRVADMAYASGRMNHTATLLPDGRVLVAGGKDTAFLTGMELFNPVANTWSTPSGVALSQGRYQHAAELVVTPAYPAGVVLFLGGSQTSTALLSSVEGFDLATQTMVSAAALQVARGAQTSTLLPSGKILLAGGRIPGSVGTTTAQDAEVYDPVTGTGTLVMLVQARTAHTASLLPGGKVLLAGGGSTALCEVLDPAAATSTATGPLTFLRASHTAVALPDGTVVVVGGSGGDGSTEVYKP